MRRPAAFIALYSIMCFSMAYAGEIAYDTGSRRDPMVALIGPEGLLQGGVPKVQSTFVIEGIIYDPEGGSVALIDGELYRPGEEIHGATLLHIYTDRIILFSEDEEKTLWLREEIAPENAGQENR
ncbi:MAG: hypothetical protein Q8R76_11320 [Candidatus Omnitrophota bacterium]|nr:hypothetical protein [Candidatus Omnitrophota bacterium]